MNRVKKHFSSEKVDYIIVFLKQVNEHLPISGTNSDVAGILSAISNIKTENANKTVMPSVIFSPLSGGNQNPRRDKMDSHRHGKMMLNR